MMRAEKDTGNELSEFEKQRQANIAERDALLKKLTLEAQSSGLFAPQLPNRLSRNNAKLQKKKTPVRKIKEEEAPVPRRMSSRLRGIAAESEAAKRKAEEEHEALQQEQKAKRIRKSGSLAYDDMVVWGQKLSASSLISADVTRGVAEPYARTFDNVDVEETADKDLKALRKEMSGLRLWDAWEPSRIKITPERVYCMTFHPSESKPLVLAGDKVGHLGILDASQEAQTLNGEDGEDIEETDPAIAAFKLHTRTISSMLIHPLKPTHLYTSSYDSSVREMDLEKTVSAERYAPESTSVDEPISSIDMATDDPNMLYWTTLDGAFGRYDLRSPRKSVVNWQLSEKKIGGFSLHPSYPHYIATASLDRTMKLWDLRKLSYDDPTPVGEHESRLSVSHAAFNSAGQVVTSSYDDSLKIYDFSSKGIASWEPGHTLSEEDMRPQTIVRHNCQTGRWVTILRPQWQLNPQSHIERFCIGNMNRFVDIYSSAGDQLAQLGGDGVTAVPAVAVFHRSKNWVVGGTASGKVCLWM